VGGGSLRWDLADNVARRNVIKVGSASGSFATGLSYTGDCTPAQLAPYLDGSKRLEFVDNKYVLPSTAGRYWLWGAEGLKSFSEWQRLGRDRQSVVSP
jgi:hypothetical protein